MARVLKLAMAVRTAGRPPCRPPALALRKVAGKVRPARL